MERGGCMKPIQGKTNTSSSPSTFLLFMFTGLSILVVCVFSVWLNISRSDIAWQIDERQKVLAEKLALYDKLETERDRLLAPDDLRKRAAKLGMAQAMPKEIRRLSEPDVVLQ